MISILDCTLRDGGYVNNWEFDNSTSRSIINSLIVANIDIIECGFVSQKKGRKKDNTLFDDIDTLNKHLLDTKAKDSTSNFVAMINYGEYDFNTLPQCDQVKGSITGLRLAFHKKDISGAYESTKVIISKGYQLYVQAMVTLSYTDQELLEMIEKFNQLDIYALYIVDSFGAMSSKDFKRLYYLFENNLKEGVHLGYHSHNNLQMAYSNSVDFLEIANDSRNIIIDSSILGMGRGAGNLNTELLADYLNKRNGRKYFTMPLLEIIDSYLEAIYREKPWGYSAAHFLSATINCHPNYSSYLINKKTLSVVEIQKILEKIDAEKKVNYDVNLVESLYLSYKSSKKLTPNIDKRLFSGRDILILASGSSTKRYEEEIKNHIVTNSSLVISVNHCPKDYHTDYQFFSNQKRYNEFLHEIDTSKLIVTSNLDIHARHKDCLISDFGKCVSMTTNRSDNVTILLMCLLIEQGIKEVSVAGFDGYDYKRRNQYSYKELGGVIDKTTMESQNRSILKSIKEISQKINIRFITSSLYQQ